MKRFSGVLSLCLLTLLPWPALAETVAEIVDEQARRGYPSPRLAIERLEQATDRPGPQAPVEARRVYLAAIARHAVLLGEPGTAERHLQPLRELGEQGCKRCMDQYLIAQAELLSRREDPERAAAAARQALEAVDPADRELQKDLAMIRSRVADAAGDYSGAVELAVRASRLATEAGDNVTHLRAINQLVLANAHLGDYSRAMAFQREGYALADQLDFHFTKGAFLLNKAYLHLLQREPAAQLADLNAALQLARAHRGLEDIELVAVNNLAAYHADQGNLKQTLRYSRQGQKLAEMLDRPMGEAIALANSGFALAGLGQVDAGVAELQRASAIVRDKGAKGFYVGVNRELAGVYERAGRFREAYLTLSDVERVQREITRDQRGRALLELQERYSAERKSREIERLQAENRLRAAEVAARQLQQRLWATLAVILVLLAVPLVQWLRSARRDNRDLIGANAVLAEQTAHDPLTGAFNRRHCYALMSRQEGLLREERRDARQAAAVGLVLLDVDNFKQVNDIHGHAVGDAVLVAVTTRLRGLLRERDAVVRWGGEEFLLALPGLSPTELKSLVARLLHTVAAKPVVVGGASVAVTISAGATSWPGFPGQHWEDALHMADLALYQSKSGGRNRATCLMSIQAGADLDGVRRNLVEAAERGDVILETVVGP